MITIKLFTYSIQYLKFNSKNHCELVTTKYSNTLVAYSNGYDDYYLRGVQAFQFRKHDFELWVGGGGLDMYQQF